MGVLLAVLGIVHIFKPNIISNTIISSYSRSPFIKNEAQLYARKGFIKFFGMVWILLGLYIVISDYL